MPILRSRPPLFRSKKTQTTTNAVQKNVNNKALGGHSADNSNFLLDSYKSGFKSTQQLALDFSQFKNHTFFSPARAKADIALHKIINQFPYTGTLAEIDNFLVGLTGFEKYVFEQVPKNSGYLLFSGTQVNESSGGTYISVSPYSGKEFYEAPGATGEQHLNIENSPFEIELHLLVPDIVNDNQIIAQRVQSSAGFTLALSQSSLTDSCNLVFLVSSASDSYVVASGSIPKGEFSRIRACLFNDSDAKKAILYSNDELIASSSDSQDFGILSFDTSSFLIGSGSRHTVLDYDFTPRQTMSGAIDEFRFFIDQRSDDSVEEYAYKQIFATASLGPYFRFDEPSGSYDMNDIVLDYSGKCLHSRISNFSQSLRNTGSFSIPLYFQNSYYSPVLYPDYVDFSDFIDDLLVSASYYDENNPNIVTNFLPRHYLEESALAVGLPNIDSGLGVAPELEHVPGTGTLAETSALLRTLILISISLDEIKQFVDSMSNLLSVELGDEEQISSQTIRFAADYFGIDLPNFFAKSTTRQFSYGEDVVDEYLTTYTLRALRDDLWRRILANMSYIRSSKGTRDAVRSIFLSSGIVPENFFTIREFGMSGESRLANLRDQSIEVTAMLDFSSSLVAPTGSTVPGGFWEDSPRLISPFLSASRVEIGFPPIHGSFVNKDEYYPHGISDEERDGLLTSGSFSIEAAYVFDQRIEHPASQSLFRLVSTGSISPKTFLIANMLYNQESADSGTLKFALRSSHETSLPDALVLVLTGVNLFDGERWTVGIERERGDIFGHNSSSYTLRCARSVGGNTVFFSTSSFYSEFLSSPSDTILSRNLSTLNASGAYIAVGSQSIGSYVKFLNNTEYTSSFFSGKISHIKFYSTAIGNTSFIEHARNFASIGTSNPEIGLGFDLVQTGAFGRLRIDASCDQATTASDSAGNIRIFDFSQNEFHLSGSGFGATRQIIKPYLTTVNRISPRFDLQQVENKVRIRGLNNPSEADPDYVITGPAYEIYNSDEITDDVRFSIEHSIVKALNEDIISTVGDPQYIENAIGQPIDLFNDTHQSFDHLSNVYFNRLTGKPDFMRTYDVFRWVDVALTDLIESILPKRTKFLGINYIVEPHVLERGKHRYRSEQSFMLTNENTFYSDVESFTDISGEMGS